MEMSNTPNGLRMDAILIDFEQLSQVSSWDLLLATCITYLALKLIFRVTAECIRQMEEKDDG